MARANLTVGGRIPAAIARPTGWSQHPPVSGAIARTFDGVTFRSTTEARFAVWFSALDLHWSYEAEGYRSGGVSAMPDFWLPRFACFVEVKHSDDYNIAKPQSVARASKCSVLMATSSPWSDPAFGFVRVYPTGEVEPGWRFAYVGHDDDGIPLDDEQVMLRHMPPRDARVDAAAQTAGNMRFWNPVR